MKQTKQNPGTCNCCEGVRVLTPSDIFNRPGLGAIAYRVGTHGSFLETMIARLSSSDFPALASLTTRQSSDASIALLDAWATVAEVLTFYQERIANEGYLRTATERHSILELARLVGYRLKPGLAASVYLAYTLESTQETAIIEPGNKAQSIPGPKETPQVFETAERLIAYSGLNLIRARLKRPQLFNSPDALMNLTIIFKGASLNLRVNDTFILEYKMLNPVTEGRAFYRAAEIKVEPQLDRTVARLNIQGLLPQFVLPPANLTAEAVAAAMVVVKKYLTLETFGLSEKSKIVTRASEQLRAFGKEVEAAEQDENLVANLPAGLQTLLQFLTDEYAFASGRGYDNIASWLIGLINELEALQTSSVFASNQGNGHTDTGTENVPQGLPSFVSLFAPFKQPQSLQPSSEAGLVRPLANIYSGRSEFVAQVYAAIQPQAAPFVKAVLANAPQVEKPTPSPRAAGVIELSKSYALRLRAFLAGHNLPSIVGGEGTSAVPVSPPTLGQYMSAIQAAGFPADPGKALTVIALDARYDQIKVGSQVAIEHARLTPQGTPTGFAITLHTVNAVNTSQLVFSDIPFTSTILTLNSPWLSVAETQGAFLQFDVFIRTTTVFAQSEELALTEIESTTEISFAANDPEPLIELDGLYSNLEPGRWAIISGERVVTDSRTNASINTGVQVSELFMVASVVHEAKTLVNGARVEVQGEKLHTFLRPAQPLAYSYKLNTVKIYGNVVRATHGETRDEVLGSGDGSKPMQSFQLRNPPLTYLAAPNPQGTESTLEVRVNDIRWREADNLFVLARENRNYITKTDDDGKTTLIFGDGLHGARLPTGVENVKAVYRSGLGRQGNVSADQIKLPLTRPLGVKSVINPLRASGGVDRETRDQARINAPIAVLALDRLVSVKDYADFARTFAGIVKASSRLLSDGAREVVHLTIAGAGNIPIDPTSDLYRNLMNALERFGDPLQPLQVESFERVLLVISAKVSLLSDYLWESVKEKLRAALLETFGFESRELGQDVTLSEVLGVIQAVPGVDYVDLQLLDSVTEEKLADANFGRKLSLKPRVNAELARVSDQRDDILPAQLVFLSPEATDTLILEEIAP